LCYISRKKTIIKYNKINIKLSAIKKENDEHISASIEAILDIMILFIVMLY